MPIIVFYCEGCQEPLTDRKILDRVVDLFREHTADIWYSKTAAELVGPDAQVRANAAARLSARRTDILDVWFDSGVEPSGGADAGELPALARRYVSGRRRSVSRLVPQFAAGGRGAEGRGSVSRVRDQRLDARWRGARAFEIAAAARRSRRSSTSTARNCCGCGSASVDFTEDVRFSDTILDRLIEAYRKLRNTFRYALGNLHDFDPEKDAVPVDEMLEIDRWILARTEDLIRRCRGWYDEMAFHKVYRAIYDFATTDLSAVYFDIFKDRLYTAATSSQARGAADRRRFYKVHYALMRLIAPLLAFTAEEVWSHTAKPAGAPDSVHLALLPEPEEVASGLDRGEARRWDRLMEVRDVVLKALEEARQAKLIGTSLEARVRLAGANIDVIRSGAAGAVHRVASGA